MNRIAMVAAAFAASQAHAEEQEALSLRLDDIVVTGGLTPLPAAALGRSLSVVTAEEIEAKGIVYAVDALRALPGLAVSRTGAPGGVTTIRIRGAENTHTQVFIDGVKAASPDNLTFDFSGLLAADIERIGVLRGPQSALFGANAIGGVISIVTKRAKAPGFTTSGSAEVGTDGSYGGDVAGRWRGERAGLSLSVARRETGGFDVSGTPGGEDDGDENLTLSLTGDFDAAETLRFGGTLRYIDRTSEFDQFNFAAADRAGLVTDADLEGERKEIYGSVFGEGETFGGRARHRLTLGYTEVRDEQFDTGARTNETKGSRRQARFQTTFALDAANVDAADHTITAAVDYEREAFRNTDPALVFDPSQLILQTREQWSGAAEYRGRFLDAVDVQLGLRHDLNDEFRDRTTWSASASWLLPNQTTRLHGSIGTGAQNPTLIDQFGFFPGSFVGNPNLKPETSFGWDIGVEQTFWGGRAAVDVTYFQDRLKDEIVSQFDPVTFLSTSVNQAGTSKRRGVEIAGRVEPAEGLTLGLTYTFLDAEEPNGDVEVRRPRHDLGLEASYRFAEDRALVVVGVNHLAGLNDFDFTDPFIAGSQVALDDRTVVNLSLSYAVTEQVEVYGRVSNLFDEDYQEVDGFDAEGRVAFLGLRARF